MRILYDHQIFGFQPFGGISRYFYELWRHAGSCGFPAEIALKYCKNEYLLQEQKLATKLQEFGNPYKDFLFGSDFKGKSKLFALKQKFFPFDYKKQKRDANLSYTLQRLSEEEYDIFHPTYFEPYFLTHLAGRPFVLTVFDMIHEVYPEYFPLEGTFSTNKKMLCQAASRIIAISEQTKQDLVSFFEISPEKIDVVHLANSLQPIKGHLPSIQEQLPERYLLFVGNRKRYKNFYFFVRAIAKLLLNDVQLKLVCTGRRFTQPEKEYFETLGVENSIRHIHADETSLAYAYQHAQAFVFPSLYEGFGLPVLEAFACGCPVILSNTSSLPEVGGDAALYCDPKDMQSLQQAVEKVLYDSEFKKCLITRGYERVKSFSWRNTAQRTFEIYQTALI